MGREGMSQGAHNEWRHPRAEKTSIEGTAIPWEDEVEKAESGELVDRIIEDLRIVDDIRKEDFPTDEETCDKIGERHGIGAAEVAALSKRLRKKKGETTH